MYTALGVSLSEPHINGLCGAGCYGITYVGMSILAFRPGCQGPLLFAPDHITRTVWLAAKMADKKHLHALYIAFMLA